MYNKEPKEKIKFNTHVFFEIPILALQDSVENMEFIHIAYEFPLIHYDNKTQEYWIYCNNKFVFKSRDEDKYALTRTIVTMLNLSMCSNKLTMEEDGIKFSNSLFCNPSIILSLSYMILGLSFIFLYNSCTILIKWIVKILNIQKTYKR